MIRTLLLVTILIFTAVSFSYAQKLIGNKNDINTILKNIKQFSTYAVEGNTQGIRSLYTNDGKIFPPGMEILSGDQNLIDYWQRTDSVKIGSHLVTPQEIRIIDNVAYDYGYYQGETHFLSGEIRPWKGKYIIIWRKENNNWKIYLDIWNSIKINK